MINLRNCDKLSVHFSRLIVNCYLDFLWIFWTFSIYIWYIVDRTLLRQASQVTVAFTSFGFWRTAWMHKVSWLTALELTEGQPGRALFVLIGFKWTLWYRGSPDRTNFRAEGNHTIAKTVLIGEWFSTKIVIWSKSNFKVHFLTDHFFQNWNLSYFQAFPWSVVNWC